MQSAVGSSSGCLFGCGFPEVNVFLIRQTVTYNVHGCDVSSLMTQAKETIAKDVSFSPGTYPEFSGTAAMSADYSNFAPHTGHRSPWSVRTGATHRPPQDAELHRRAETPVSRLHCGHFTGKSSKPNLRLITK